MADENKTRTVRERLALRAATEGSVPKLTDAQVNLIVDTLRSRPDWDRIYLFYDGSIEGPDAGLKTDPGRDLSKREERNLARYPKAPHDTPVRREQLLSISTRGFPVCIGRGHSQIKARLAETAST